MNRLINKINLPLEIKEKMSLSRIKSFYYNVDGKIYIAYSGGLDSTVLLHLVRRIYPWVEGVFCNTGLEYPENVIQVKNTENVRILIPKLNFTQVIEKYGYPVISKEVSMSISRYRNSDKPSVKLYRKYGIDAFGEIGKVGVIPQKWHYLIDAPFKISEKCCYYCKKQPFKKFENGCGSKPIIGTMAHESAIRKRLYNEYGCNVLGENAKSQPLSFWTKKDIWEYIKKYKLEYSSIYDKGEKRTGCTYCTFGAHLEKSPNRFERLKKIHPNLYDYCINKLGLGKVLKFIGVKY